MRDVKYAASALHIWRPRFVGISGARMVSAPLLVSRSEQTGGSQEVQGCNNEGVEVATPVFDIHASKSSGSDANGTYESWSVTWRRL